MSPVCPSQKVAGAQTVWLGLVCVWSVRIAPNVPAAQLRVPATVTGSVWMSAFPPQTGCEYTFCSVSSVRFLLFGFFCSVSSVRFLLFGFFCSVSSVRFLLFGFFCSVSSVRFLLFGFFCSVSSFGLFETNVRQDRSPPCVTGRGNPSGTGCEGPASRDNGHCPTSLFLDVPVSRTLAERVQTVDADWA